MFAMDLLVGSSVVRSVLTLVGLYGTLSLSVTSRHRERLSARRLARISDTCTV
jgi:hypothetical protein